VPEPKIPHYEINDSGSQHAFVSLSEIAQLQAAILDAADLADVIYRITNILSMTLEIDIIFVLGYDRNDKTMNLLGKLGNSNARYSPATDILTPDTIHQLLRGETVTVSHGEIDGVAVSFGIWYPLRLAKDRIVGTLGLFRLKPVRLSAPDNIVLETVLGSIAQAIYQNQQMMTQRQRIQRLERIENMSRELTSATSTEEVVETAMHWTPLILGFDGALLGDAHDRRFILHGTGRQNERRMWKPEINRFQPSWCKLIERLQRPVFIQGHRLPRLLNEGSVPSDLLVIPLLGRAHKTGRVLVLWHDHFHRVPREVVSMASVVGHHVSMAWENIGLLGKMRYQIDHDELTGLWNQRALWQDLSQSVGEALQEFPVVFAMLDIDNFKKINDTFGHRAGDRVLQQFSAALSRAIADKPTVKGYRVGGDEFSLIASPSSRQAVMEIVDHIYQDIGLNLNPPISMSVGIAAITGPVGSELLFQQADLALYTAKHGGKGRVFYESTTNPET
jgi:diguanylate cyclase (GGDEF)-like protein